MTTQHCFYKKIELQKFLTFVGFKNVLHSHEIRSGKTLYQKSDAK